uniref:Uncharacterized protein n=1 Tax=Setaria viridis TaxID=4556 RepID=A0A4U6TI21_SETVI|nr:hypothetical protein SEVIR_9G465050v2 [Setaria viridis]
MVQLHAFVVLFFYIFSVYKINAETACLQGLCYLQVEK